MDIECLYGLLGLKMLAKTYDTDNANIYQSMMVKLVDFLRTVLKTFGCTMTHQAMHGIGWAQKKTKFMMISLGMVACLTALEAVHLIVLGAWNAEIFAVISALIGNITGIF